jgi:tellurium resistance protein TerZ
MAKLSREGAGWKFTAIGQPANGRTVGDLVGPSAAVL